MATKTTNAKIDTEVVDPVLDKVLVNKLIGVVRKGLSCGLGEAKPGKMCVEAAVCYAYGLPHNDNPPCVGNAVRAFKIQLNDSTWTSPKARAKGMIELSIAQLNSNTIDQKVFSEELMLAAIRTRGAEIAKKYDLTEIAKTLKTAKTFTEVYDMLITVRDTAEDEKKEFMQKLICGCTSSVTGKADYVADAYAQLQGQHRRTNVYLIEAAQLCLKILKKMKSPGCKYLYLLNK